VYVNDRITYLLTKKPNPEPEKVSGFLFEKTVDMIYEINDVDNMERSDNINLPRSLKIKLGVLAKAIMDWKQIILFSTRVHGSIPCWVSRIQVAAADSHG
jgi:hypothetical protein